MFPRVCLLCCLVLTIVVHTVHAQDPSGRAFTSLGSGGGAQGGSVSGLGNLSISLPLMLPSPRGGLPQPFSVVYNGSNAVGAAGTGWDVPILSVTRQRNISRRKPVHRFTGELEPITADRVFVDVGNGSMLMAPTNNPNIFQPFLNGFFELRFEAGGFTGRDGSGRRWVFQKIAALFDDDFFALIRIEDASGVNRVELAYDVYDKFSAEPITTPRADQISARELVLREVSYSHNENGSCPKYRIKLHYSVSPLPLAIEFTRGRPRTRSRLLQQVELLTGSKTTCEPDSIRSAETYRIEYKSDSVTGRPRLTSVDLFGPPTGPVPQKLPVVTYRYGNAIQANGTLTYQQAENIRLPPGPPRAHRGFAASLGVEFGGLYGRVRGFEDMNGDGRLDFVSIDSTAQKPLLAMNRPSLLGNDFSTLLTPIELPNDPAAPYNIGTPDLAVGLPVASSVENTFRQVIDFNGDGRPDIVMSDAKNGSGQWDPNLWRVLINQRGPSGQVSDIVWLERKIDITALRSAIMAKHLLSLMASTDQRSKLLPLERTHSTGAFKDNRGLEHAVLTQWKLIDVNADGFPDFVFDNEGVTAWNENQCDPQGNCQQILRQDHPRHAKLMVFYHTGPMMAGSGGEPQSVWRGPAIVLREDGACGVTRLVTSARGVVEMKCGFREANGDGIVDYVISEGDQHRVILSPGLAQAHDVRLPENQVPGDYSQHEQKRTIKLPGLVGVLKDQRATACSGAPAGATYQLEQISELRDITGDGIADYVFSGGPQMPPGNPEGPQGWWYMAGTGTGFVNPRRIISPSNVPFALMVSSERCDGISSNTVSALMDLDGDGRPEIVHSPNVMNVNVAKLANEAGELGVHDAGQITEIDNRYGSVTRIRYGSAKSDARTQQNLPYPQIVITQTQQIAAFNIGTSMEPVRYAYGAPEQLYHPMIGRFVFSGYTRRVEIHGLPQTFDSVSGTAVFTGGASSIQFNNIRDKLMLTGRPINIVALAGTAPADPRRLLGSTGSMPRVEHTGLKWKIKDLPGTVPALVPLDEECYATPSPETPGEFGDLSLCRRTAIAYVEESTTSEGSTSFPHSDNIASRMQVTQVDALGRPLSIRMDGDLRSSDDDICYQTDYAAPIAGAPLLLNVPKTIRSHDCANASRLLSFARFDYDDLPHGHVRIGRPTARILERRNTATGQLIATVPTATLGRDPYGNLIEVTRRTTSGASTTTKIAYDPFGLMPVRSETTATGLATPLVTTTIRHAHSLVPLVVTDTTGASLHNRYDTFSRLRGVSLSKPGDPVRYALVDIALTGFNGASTGRSIRYKVFHKFVPESQAQTAPANSFTTSTILIDEFAREFYSTVELGPDYQGKAMIVGLVKYDGLGRPTFMADPFQANVLVGRYGTSFTYHPDGRPACMIQGQGLQIEPTTDESSHRYPTCRSYSYRNSQLVVQTQGPNEIASGKPQSGAYDEEVLSATGQLLRRSRMKDGAALELAEYGYDRLGNPSYLIRYANPNTLSGHTRWNWTNDSLGHVLEVSETANVARRFTYDEGGNVTAVNWNDAIANAPSTRSVNFVYDGLARLTRTFELINGQQQPETLKEYFYDLPSGQPQHHDTQFLAGRLSFARAGERAQYFGYDSLGRLTTVTHSEFGENVTERAVMGAAGQTESIQYFTPGGPSQGVTFGYDSAQQLQSVTYKEAAKVSELWRALERDMYGRVLRSVRGNGAVEQFTYRDEGRRELLSKRVDVNHRSRELIFDRFDGAMLLQGVTEKAGITGEAETTTRYYYDARSALTRTSAVTGGPTSSDLSYSYDGLGNLTQIIDAIGSGSMKFRADTADPDRICSAGNPPPKTCTYMYDARGALQSVQTDSSFAYDGDGQVRYARVNSREASMKYDSFGSLSQLHVRDGDVVRRESFLGDVSRVGFFNRAGTPTVVGPPAEGLQNFTQIMVNSPIGTVAAIRRSNTGAGAILYPIGESQGTRNVLGADGAATQAIRYDAYGNVLADTGTTSSLAFFTSQWNGGQVLKDFGLVMLGARILDNRTGRFLQRDPLINTSTSVTSHPYAFAWNNPVSFTDPSGAEPEETTDPGIGGLMGMMGAMAQAHDYMPGETVEPEIEIDWGCGGYRDCISGVEKTYGSLTQFEDELRAQFHTRTKKNYTGVEGYQLVTDRLSGAIIGYAFFRNNIEVYDREGGVVAMLNNERPLETVLLSPTDFIPTGWVGRIFGRAVRSTTRAAMGAANVGVRAARAPAVPWRYGPSSMKVAGDTDFAGNILINPGLKQGSQKFNHVLRHEAYHRSRTALSGPLIGFRQKATELFYLNSHLLKYTEEALAERAASGSLWRGLKFPFDPHYRISKPRLFFEGLGYTGVTLSGGAYQLWRDR